MLNVAAKVGPPGTGREGIDAAKTATRHLIEADAAPAQPA
jgi:hypothetical protein